jgi:ribosomal protein S18 acetylase RimI-like enzyme
MLSPGLVIRSAELRDARPLAVLGARTFADAFGGDNTPEDLRMYLAGAYGESQQLSELANHDIRTLVVDDGGVLVAFAQVRRAPAPACVTLPLPVEVWRFYVDRTSHGRGVARPLMDAALTAAGELGGASVWLSVWERNPRAIAFYTKCGFTDVGSKLFIVGADPQNDRVMAREIPHSPAV